MWSMPSGPFTVHAITDGWVRRRGPDVFPGTADADWADHGGSEFDSRFGCFAITGRGRPIVVDTGLGQAAGLESGRLPGLLAMIDVSPDDVGAVVHTHLHLDHIGGDLDDDGNPRFPHARHVVQRAELDHWQTAPGDAADGVRAVIDGLGDLVEPVDGEAVIASGIVTFPTPGHTPGHQSIRVGIGDDRTVITGDVTHHPIQVARPDIASIYDTDPATATVTRRSLFDALARSGESMAAGHYPAPGVGYIIDDGGLRRFVTRPAIQEA